MVQAVNLVSKFAKKYSISDFAIASAMISSAEIQLGDDAGIDAYFDEGGKFTKWLRSIDNPDNDEECARFLVKVSTIQRISLDHLCNFHFSTRNNKDVPLRLICTHPHCINFVRSPEFSILNHRTLIKL